MNKLKQNLPSLCTDVTDAVFKLLFLRLALFFLWDDARCRIENVTWQDAFFKLIDWFIFLSKNKERKEAGEEISNCYDEKLENIP